MLIPQLTPDTVSDTGVSVPPPKFRPIVGPISDASYRSSGASGGVGLTEAQKAGLRYEAKVQSYLAANLPGYIVAPMLFFSDNGMPRKLVPDGIFAEAGHIMIFEIKRQHMPEAWWQLRKLYEPVVRAVPWVRSTSVVEIVRSYDPSMGFPEPVTVYDNLYSLIVAPFDGFKVLVWK